MASQSPLRGSRSRSPSQNPEKNQQPSQSHSPSRSHTSHSPSAQQQQPQPARLPIRTYHCTFCNHLLLSSTRDILNTCARRRSPGLDNALILPIPPPEPSDSESSSGSDSEAEVDEEAQQATTSSEPASTTKRNHKREKRTARRARRQRQHTTLLLSTTHPDRKPVIIRRSDGFEKRLCLRCGRCRVVVGYVLDEVHFPSPASLDGGGGGAAQEGSEQGHSEDEGEEGAMRNMRKRSDEVVYLLPDAVVQTEDIGKANSAAGKEEWRAWGRLAEKTGTA
ncbi:hypothetical protein AJ80_07711 [Polytolypa hystricis UAMH7299]|uniref:STEEP1 domain-containing protein n=1 Tax=Polytolypa hystricis (strain UAMH7299) TaxID=1447883 RepID=A0A2B7XC48_POLH7|nr:hypothetical protein AJ80_07711 [Polytolypa hystricis UAMH7299]